MPTWAWVIIGVGVLLIVASCFKGGRAFIVGLFELLTDIVNIFD
jgi:hypothetical protein